MKTVAAVVWLGALLMGCPAGLAADGRTLQVDAVFANLTSNQDPGAAVLVIRNGRTVYQRGYGVTDLRTMHPIDANTNFRLASLTKQFTAMAILLLVHDGKLHYEDHLSDVLPGFPAYGKKITIRELLNHTSGLKDYEDLMPPSDPKAPVEEVQIKDDGVVDLLERQTATKFHPGSKWDYSNSGYVVLGIIVAKVSGEPFGQFLQERIFAPLRMTGTVMYERGKNQVSQRAYGHSLQKGKWKETDQSPTSATQGDGGIYTSLHDMSLWDKALREHTLLNEAEMRPGITPVKVPGAGPTEPDGKPAAYGFGWFLNPYKRHSRMWHYGETAGFRTAIQRFQADGLTIVILSNRSDLSPTKLALKVADVYLGAH
jgi:CubicO group peptidase (beta-lactamase class C family)